MKPTYVLFVPGKRVPSVFHSSIETAREEAARLIDQPDNQKVMICQFVEGLEKVVAKKALKKNPLDDREAEPIF